MTYSIVARDPETGQLGVAVQTCMFAVGTIVPWAVAGVGAVATQAMAEPAYGPRCLDAMAGGASAVEALAQARALDPGSAVRQVGVVDANGTADAFTGELRIDHAGHLVGEGWTVQANMMASPAVWPAMAEAYEFTTGPLGERMLAALRAAEGAGGDARGRMSAALLIVDGERQPDPWQGRLIDIRVDRTAGDPVAELGELYRAALAFGRFGRATDALMAGNPAGALDELERGLDLLPGEANLRFLRVGALMGAGRTDEGLAELRALLAEMPSWTVVARSFAERGFVAAPPGVDLDAVLAS